MTESGRPDRPRKAPRRSWALFTLIALLLAVHVAYTVRYLGQDYLLELGDGTSFQLQEIVEDLKQAKAVFVGELHDQPSHHEAQLRVIRALHEADHPIAIGLEMFRADSQPELNRWISGSLSLGEFLPSYYSNWNFPWIYYADIFEYAREHRVPMVGLNVSQEVIRQVARKGFASLSPEQTGKLPAVRCDVDETYEDFIRRALGMHDHGGRAFTNFCEAQLVWDTSMALNLLDFLQASPEYTVVVVAGSGHAWKRGIPEQLRQREDVTMRILVPEIPGRLELASVTEEDADYLWVGLGLRL